MRASRLIVNLQPAQARLFAYQGDPFDFTIRLVVEGALVDVGEWDWRATIDTGAERVDFEWENEPDGVRLWLRGDDTARLPRDRELRLDVTGRGPEAGEGVTVLRGSIIAAPRVTQPLRASVDDLLVPSPT